MGLELLLHVIRSGHRRPRLQPFDDDALGVALGRLLENGRHVWD